MFSPDGVFRRSEQVRGDSPLSAASQVLEHAAEYLIQEHVERRGPGAAATQEAIGLLCAAGERLMTEERRRVERQEMAGWMRGAARSRAAMAKECW